MELAPLTSTIVSEEIKLTNIHHEAFYDDITREGEKCFFQL